MVNDRPVRCFACAWRQADFAGRAVQVGRPDSQTFFEILALLLAIELWCQNGEATVVLGDNTAALQEALALKGKGPQGELAQALAVLRCSRSLNLEVAHLPTESNHIADSLSRQADPVPAEWPFSPEQGVIQDTPLSPTALWEWIR